MTAGAVAAGQGRNAGAVGIGDGFDRNQSINSKR
jgi:hypothetical protein